MCYINARSVRNTTLFLNDFIFTPNFNLFAISETWLGCEATNDIHFNSILPDGYMMHHVDRNSELRGGCIALIYKMCLEVRPNKLVKFTQFAHMSCRVIIKKMNIDIVVFYRPSTSPHNGLTTTTFLHSHGATLCHAFTTSDPPYKNTTRYNPVCASTQRNDNVHYQSQKNPAAPLTCLN